jgi:hypothetical protein
MRSNEKFVRGLQIMVNSKTGKLPLFFGIHGIRSLYHPLDGKGRREVNLPSQRGCLMTEMSR